MLGALCNASRGVVHRGDYGRSQVHINLLGTVCHPRQRGPGVLDAKVERPGLRLIDHKL
jgi:glycine cleavage system protein P-like pyridoxal-binding family